MVRSQSDSQPSGAATMMPLSAVQFSVSVLSLLFLVFASY
jgi:hypothetical protein